MYPHRFKHHIYVIVNIDHLKSDYYTGIEECKAYKTVWGSETMSQQKMINIKVGTKHKGSIQRAAVGKSFILKITHCKSAAMTIKSYKLRDHN